MATKSLFKKKKHDLLPCWGNYVHQRLSQAVNKSEVSVKLPEIMCKFVSYVTANTCFQHYSHNHHSTHGETN